jgi:hypothetical protein
MSETSTSYAKNIQIAQSVASRRKSVFTWSMWPAAGLIAKWSQTTSICL